jgi:hypothetical protein
MSINMRLLWQWQVKMLSVASGDVTRAAGIPPEAVVRAK